TFTGTYTASSPCLGGTFTITVQGNGIFWDGAGVDGNPACSGPSSGHISGGTLFGTGLAGVGVNGTVDCIDGTVSGMLPGPISGSFSLSYCPDPHDVNDVYTWSATGGGTTPNGTVFTSFLGTLNNGTSFDYTTINGCFAGHCDWRLPTIVELSGI